MSGNLSHPVYAGQISAWDRRELAGPSAWTWLLSPSLFPICSLPLFVLKSSVCKGFHTDSLLSTPSNPKQTSTRLAHSTLPMATESRLGRKRKRDEKESFKWRLNAAKSHNSLFNIHVCSYSYFVIFTVSWFEPRTPGRKNVFMAVKSKSRVRIFEPG